MLLACLNEVEFAAENLSAQGAEQPPDKEGGALPVHLGGPGLCEPLPVRGEAELEEDYEQPRGRVREAQHDGDGI